MKFEKDIAPDNMQKDSKSIDDMLREIREQPKIITHTIEANVQTFESCGHALHSYVKNGDINNMVTVARGSSDNASLLGKYIIEIETGLPVSSAAPSVINLYGAQLNLAKSLVIATSQSGRTNEIVSFMKKVKDTAKFTASMTNNTDSDLAQMGLDCDFFCHAGSEKALAATKTFTSTVTLFYLLASTLKAGKPDLGQLGSIPDLIRDTLKLEPKIKHLGEWLSKYEDCIVIARGLNYPVAMETALKLQETSYIRAKAYSAADFQHGPMAITEEGLPFIAFLADDQSYDGMKWLCQSIIEKEGDLLVITESSEDLEKKEDVGDLKNAGARILEIPASAWQISPFIFTVAGQCLAYYTSKAKGIDPDDPRWLNKVTATV